MFVFVDTRNVQAAALLDGSCSSPEAPLAIRCLLFTKLFALTDRAKFFEGIRHIKAPILGF